MQGEKIFCFNGVYYILFSLYPIDTYSKKLAVSDECKAEMEDAYENFLKDVFEDVLKTYDYLNKESDNDNVFYFTREDLFHINYLIGKTNELIDSLRQYFTGVTMGERRLYFFGGEPDTAYILYKDESDNNVMVKVKRKKTEWVEIDRTVKKGRKIELKQPECLQDR